MTKEKVLQNWHNILDYIPVNWKSKESIKSFSLVHDLYAKAYQDLKQDEQGWISEQVTKYLKE